MATPAALPEPVRNLLSASVEKRMQWILADSWVHTPNTRAAFQWMAYMLRSGPSIRPNGLQVIGDGGMGKTAILLTFADQYPVIPTDDPLRLQRRVLFAECKAEPGGAQGIRSAILRGAWPNALNFSYSEMEVDRTLSAQGVVLVILDEFGELTKSGPALHKKALSELKRIGNVNRVAFAISTVKNLAHVLDVDPQFASRFKRKIRLPPWELSQDLRNFAYGLECNLPFPERSNFDGPEVHPWLARHGEGNTREIVELVRLAALHALGENSPCVTLSHFKTAKSSVLPPPIVLTRAA